MNERESLLANVVEHGPEDFVPLLVFADWLEEHGEYNLAYAYRWAAGRKRWPRITPKRRLVGWGTETRRKRSEERRAFAPHHLPVLLFQQMKRSERGNCKTVPLAFAVLAQGLRKLREVVSLEVLP